MLELRPVTFTVFPVPSYTIRSPLPWSTAKEKSAFTPEAALPSVGIKPTADPAFKTTILDAPLPETKLIVIVVASVTPKDTVEAVSGSNASAVPDTAKV